MILTTLLGPGDSKTVINIGDDCLSQPVDDCGDHHTSQEQGQGVSGSEQGGRLRDVAIGRSSSGGTLDNSPVI